ncbi:ATPase, T2SS/T4P/T4SS family (plasmid) [Niallia taxi]|uniref:CpaF/VirB11 family protein n=1 Tax=Niallia TaxID=2837506 RepID=UPI0015F54080|nr:CpaF/VirB11 family protein [Niallia taxi]MED4057141.1 CpaF/VirB11 family protein [Niallia taxi]MED4122171.1 CpaF/VirB11 family protein [Niallia taxi]
MSISEDLLLEIKNDLRENHAEEFQEAFADLETREVLKKIIANKHGSILNDDEKLESVVRELVGLGLVEELREDLRVTDVGFDGTKLIVEGNGIEKYSLETVSENEVIKLIAKFSNSTGKEISSKNPILNTSKDFMRLNAVHKQNAPSGTTMAIRISRPYMALSEENFKDFAPLEILEFLKAAVKGRSNMVIAGETGSGKTEFQKLLMSYIPFKERMAVIESTIDIYAKELWPNKDIFSWLATEGVSIEELIAYAGLRSHPVWIIVGEILGKEVYQMLQGILTGHRFMTTAHAYDARAIPKRLLGMAKSGYEVDDKMFLDDIYSYVHFGIHLKKINGRRFLSEIVEFHGDHTATTVFKQRMKKDGSLDISYGELSQDFFERIHELGSDFEGFKRDEE